MADVPIPISEDEYRQLAVLLVAMYSRNPTVRSLMEQLEVAVYLAEPEGITQREDRLRLLAAGYARRIGELRQLRERMHREAAARVAAIRALREASGLGWNTRDRANDPGTGSAFYTQDSRGQAPWRRMLGRIGINRPG